MNKNIIKTIVIVGLCIILSGLVYAFGVNPQTIKPKQNFQHQFTEQQFDDFLLLDHTKYNTDFYITEIELIDDESLDIKGTTKEYNYDPKNKIITEQDVSFSFPIPFTGNYNNDLNVIKKVLTVELERKQNIIRNIQDQLSYVKPTLSNNYKDLEGKSASELFDS